MTRKTFFAHILKVQIVQSESKKVYHTLCCTEVLACGVPLNQLGCSEFDFSSRLTSINSTREDHQGECSQSGAPMSGCKRHRLQLVDRSMGLQRSVIVGHEIIPQRGKGHGNSVQYMACLRLHTRLYQRTQP